MRFRRKRENKSDLVAQDAASQAAEERPAGGVGARWTEAQAGPDHLFLSEELGSDVTPPQNVRIKHWDGSETPVELVYEGLDESGVHQWVAVPTAPVASRYAQILVDVLPAKTGIRLRMEA